jgi:hypothetical protein
VCFTLIVLYNVNRQEAFCSWLSVVVCSTFIVL